jgi:hypothetical protein
MGKKRRTIDDDYNSYIESYRIRVSRGATIREIAEYGIAKEHLRLPDPKEPKEILIQRMTKAQRKQMSYDEALRQEYNTNICYFQGDEVFWIQNDKADLEKFLYNCHLRRNIAVGVMTGVERNRRHWNRTRPSKEQVEQLPLDLGFDVDLKLNQSDADADDKRQTGS